MAHTVSSLNSIFKYVQKDLKDLTPNSAILFNSVPHREADSLGRKYLQPVVLSFELGFTWGDGTAFQYNDDVAGVYDEAELESNAVVLKSRLAIEVLERMKGNKAVQNHLSLRSGQMKMSLSKMAEIDMIYGRTGIATISAVSAVNTTPEPDQLTITISDASWAPGIWAGMVGAKLDVYNGGSKINTNADCTLVSVNMDAKQIVISGHNTDLTNTIAPYTLFFKGSKANQMYGLYYQLDNATTLFGIDAATYDLFKASEMTVSGELTVKKILSGVAKARAKGGLDEECFLFVSDLSFQGLVADLLPLREFDQSYKGEAVIGHDSIKIKSNASTIEIVGHPFFKEGEAMLIPKKTMIKVGPTPEITFKIPGKNEEYFEPLEGYDAVQMTGRYNFQVFVQEPAKCTLFKSITNAA